MIRTRVGYAGGTTEGPTYQNLGDHSETIQIDYDPSQISYEELLAVFWDSHSPTVRPWSRQYASALFYHDEAQRRQAQASLDRQLAENGGRIFTEIQPYTGFTLAEDYHQKYRLRGAPELEAEFLAIYPNPGDFVNSTAAARVNGYLAGYGSSQALRAELEALGLSPAAQEALLERVLAWER